MDRSEARAVLRWRRDLGAYAARNLKILTKAGRIVPLGLNAAQRKLEAACARCLEETGRVRLVVPKYRQGGVSTGTSARFVRDTQLRGGVRVQIVTHRQDATKNLAEMMWRFYDHLPADGRQATVKRNDTMAVFGNESSYTLQTAGSAAAPGATGRSRTATRVHASEFAFWVGAGDRIAGLGQTLADEPGTECIAESTCQGTANPYYTLWRLAQSRSTDWRGLFLPWFDEPAYRREPPPGWRPSRVKESDLAPSEHDYGDMHGLSWAQVYWRKLKIAELSLGASDGYLLWAQEYPATAEEAFVTSGDTAFLNPHQIDDARKRTIDLAHVADAPMVLGIDPATSHGRDLTVFVRRRRYKWYGIEPYHHLKPDQIVGRAWQIFTEERPTVITVDRSEGVGDHVFHALGARGAPVIGVYFGGAPDLPSRYGNRRAELYGRMAEALPFLDIPDDLDLMQDLLAQAARPLENQRLLLEDKNKLKALGHRSPDRADAAATTYAYVDPEAAVGPPVRAAVRPAFSGHPGAVGLRR